MPKEQYPDFKQLNDRFILDEPEGPFLSIKTNLDTENSLDENPYHKEDTTEQEKQKLRKYFDET